MHFQHNDLNMFIFTGRIQLGRLKRQYQKKNAQSFKSYTKGLVN